MSYPKFTRTRATIRLALSLMVAVSLGWLALPPAVWNQFEPRASAAGFTVTTADDNGDNGSPLAGSLRQAIIDANNTADTDTITFQIGSGVQTIKPLSPLPVITSPVIIDGTSQPGFAGTPIIELNGMSAGANAAGLHITAGNSTIKGLVINRFSVGIYTTTNGNNIITGNYIGTDVTGTISRGNTTFGINMEGGNGNTIGGKTVAERNIISGNGNTGLRLDGSSSNNVWGNYIGTDVSGNIDLGNGNQGLRMDNATGNKIGGTGAGEGNVISGNNDVAVRITSASNNTVAGNRIGTNAAGTINLGNTGGGVHVFGGSRNFISSNSIAYNGGLGIDLDVDTKAPDDGVTPNDAGDADTGSNLLQNFPVITSVVPQGSDMVIQGTLNSEASKTYRIELFSNMVCHPEGNGEGLQFLSSTNITTDGNGDAGFSFTIPTASITGAVFTATATDPDNNTSEFSQCKTPSQPSAGTIQFLSSTYSVSEGSATATIGVTRTGGSVGAVSVSYLTQNGTANAPSDYTAKTGQIDFADGETFKLITINIANDAVSEPTENFLITLSNPTNGAALGAQSTVTTSIIENDVSTISISDVQLVEGDSGTTNATFTVSLSAAYYKDVTVDFATDVTGTAASGSDYQPASGTLTFAVGETSKPVTVLVNGDTTPESNETFFVKLSNSSDLPFGKSTGTGTIIDDDAPGGIIELSNAAYTIKEGTASTPQGFTSLTVNVIRSGNISTAATAQYNTLDTSAGNECNLTTGQASQRCDYTTVAGTLRFAAGEGAKQIQIPIINDGYTEGSEVFKITLKNAVSASLGPVNQATVTITDSGNPATNSANNPYLSNSFFVRMNYLDFLGREPDTNGFTDWTNVLNNCGPEKGFLGAPPDCDRAHVSHGFFASPEFTDKGFLIYRMYEVGMGRLPLYAEFIPDMATLSGFGIPASLEQQNLQDYLESFSQRAEFINRFQGALLTNQAEDLILKLEQTTGLALPATATTNPGQPTQYGRNELVQKRASGQFTVGQTVKAFVEQQAVYDKYFPRGFVTMQYFAYLRRDPNLNDPNLLGWNDWVDVFTNGKASAGIQPKDYHHLIFGFIYSVEYRKRFGTP